MYIAIQNLPRQHRFHRENIIICGVIPGPPEPKSHMNSYLEPLVDELRILCKGISMKCYGGVEVNISAFLMCLACDIPAARKCGGFVGHNAIKGCSRCLKTFPTANFGEKPNYGGFDFDNWIPRTNEDHRQASMEHKLANTQDARKRIEHTVGAKYSVLSSLPYYDSICYTIVDPMHNLLLGSAKHTMVVWKDKGIVSANNFTVIQAIIDGFNVPPDVGRIPHKVQSGFASFTADQWKNWTLIYSLIALKEILPQDHYECWGHFVHACYYLCSRAIRPDSLRKAHSLLVLFCKSFESLYGTECCTMNMHLHCHLSECIRDHGPAYSFWLFSFERYNGILGAVHTNNHSIEMQMMRKFIASQQLWATMGQPDNSALSTEFTQMLDVYSERGKAFELASDSDYFATFHSNDFKGDYAQLLPPLKERVLNSVDLHLIGFSYRLIFGDDYVQTLRVYKSAAQARIRGELYGCAHSRNRNRSVALVRTVEDGETCVRPAILRDFSAYTTIINCDSEEKSYTTYMVRVSCVRVGIAAMRTYW